MCLAAVAACGTNRATSAATRRSQANTEVEMSSRCAQCLVPPCRSDGVATRAAEPSCPARPTRPVYAASACVSRRAAFVASLNAASDKAHLDFADSASAALGRCAALRASTAAAPACGPPRRSRVEFGACPSASSKRRPSFQGRGARAIQRRGAREIPRSQGRHPAGC